ncbi:MAG: hypothetical protein U0169_15430 [Polyangiaceae bacterium]
MSPEASGTAVEAVEHGGTILAYLFRTTPTPDRTTFVTPPSLPLQVGHVVYPAGGAVRPHRHVPVTRTLGATSEVVLVQEGRCALDLYDDAGVLVTTRELGTGDCAIFVAGGHGLRMHEHTVLLEVKQGPYGGPDEKECF